ncbi:MAG: aminotransferase class I/II-fold pyridoxal phosphate-dependent enzyme [Tindallia sp. MSAO_Bac2]|nr:MAG: aminotransferase class I/II-fold pyridoxal phosphate-dependent enzyme [Tindallia sp. MSAO_Bac2]
MKHPFLAKSYWNQQPTDLAKVFQRAVDTPNLIDLSLGDPDFHTDPRIADAALEDVKAGWTHYTDSLGIPELRKTIAADYAKTHQLHYDINELMITVGACHGTYLALEAILDPGDEVIVPSPHFTPYDGQIRLAGGVPVYLPVEEKDGFQVDPEKMIQKLTNRTRAILVNTPNNPTGACYSRELLESIGEIAEKNDLILLADEVYGAFTYNQPYTPLASLKGLKERTITLGSFSKEYTMTGWRLGYVAAIPEIVQCMRDINEGICFSAPAVSQRAAMKAIELKSEIQPKLKEIYRQRMIKAYQLINNTPYFSVTEPQGAFYMMVNCKETGYSSEQVMLKILEKAGVLMLPGTAFGDAGEGYLRLACTVTEEVMEEAFDRIKKISWS